MKPTPEQIKAFHEAHDASLEMQPREHTQAVYDGLCAALSLQVPFHVADKITVLEEQIASLEDALDEAQQVPWPEWSTQILKIVRSYSGYDGYDDATEGVDLVAEVDEALAELNAAAENAYVKADEVERLRASRDALKVAEPYVELCHSLMTQKETRAQVWAVLKQVRAALSGE